MQQYSDLAFRETRTYAYRLRHFEAMLFRCTEYLQETSLVHVPPVSKQKILDFVHKPYLWIYCHLQERTRREEAVWRDTSEILEIRRWGRRAEDREEWGSLLRETRAPEGAVAP
jgi:hypothetical protein